MGFNREDVQRRLENPDEYGGEVAYILNGLSADLRAALAEMERLEAWEVIAGDEPGRWPCGCAVSVVDSFGKREIVSECDEHRYMREQAEARAVEMRAILEAINVALARQGGVTDFELSLPPVRAIVDALAALKRTETLLADAEARATALQQDVEMLRAGWTDDERADFLVKLGSLQADNERLQASTERLKEALRAANSELWRTYFDTPRLRPLFDKIAAALREEA